VNIERKRERERERKRKREKEQKNDVVHSRSELHLVIIYDEETTFHVHTTMLQKIKFFRFFWKGYICYKGNSKRLKNKRDTLKSALKNVWLQCFLLNKYEENICLIVWKKQKQSLHTISLAKFINTKISILFQKNSVNFWRNRFN